MAILDELKNKLSQSKSAFSRIISSSAKNPIVNAVATGVSQAVKGPVLSNPELIKDIARSAPRAMGSVQLSVLEKFGGPDELTPETKFQKFLFGKEPVKSVGKRVFENEKSLEKYGVNPRLAGGLATIGVVGGTALDILPPTAGRGKVAKEAAEAVGEIGIKRALPNLDLTTKRTLDRIMNLLNDTKLSKQDVAVADEYLTGMAKYFLKPDEIESGLKLGKNIVNEDVVRLKRLGRMLEKKYIKPTGNIGIEATEPLYSSPAKKEIDEMFVNKKFVQSLKEASPLNKMQSEIYKAERARRFSEASGVKAGGEAGLYKEMGKLEGAMPKVDISPLRGRFTQDEVDALVNTVKNSGAFNNLGESVAARKALIDLIDGRVPPASRIELLERVFKTDIQSIVDSKKTGLQKVWDIVKDISNANKSISAGADISAMGRQGLFLIRRYKQFLPAFGDQIRFFKSEKNYVESMKALAQRPTYKTMVDSGLSLTDTGKDLAKKEEYFASKLAEKIPGIGAFVKGGDRAFTGALNNLRANVWDDMVKNAERLGVTPETNPGLYEEISKYINNATGRGDLGRFEKYATDLNTMFFSPRLMASRVNLLNPITYVKMDPYVRKEALKDAAAVGALGLTVVGLAKMAGAEVEDDPRSSDFGKIKVGNTRYDIWGGFQQYVRLAAVLLTGETKSSTTGKVTKLGKTYGAPTRLGFAGKFLRGKLAPTPAAIADIIEGKNIVGDDVVAPKRAVQSFVPLIWQDWNDLAQEGLTTENVAKSIPATLAPIVGIGVNTYGPKEKGKYVPKKPLL